MRGSGSSVPKSDRQTPIEKRRYALKFAVVSVAYLVAAKIGLSLDAVGGFATLVWPPSGIALVALFIFGSRLWPAVFAAAVLVNWWTGAPLLTACGIGVGNTLEPLIGAYFLRRGGFQPALHRLQDVMRLTLVAALFSTTLSATIGIASLLAGGTLTFAAARPAWGAWWIGDALGDLIVGALLFVWCDWWKTSGKFRQRLPWHFGRRRRIEAGALVGALAFVSIVFVMHSSLPPEFYVPLPYLIVPLILWAALRFGVLATVTLTFTISCLAIWSTANGVGPFAGESLASALTQLQLFNGALGVTALIVAAAVAERIRADRMVRQSEERVIAAERLRPILHASYDAFVAMDAEGAITEWNRQAEITFGHLRAEVLGKILADVVFPAPSRAAHKAGLAHFLATNESNLMNRRLEVRMLHRDGQEIPTEMTISPVQIGNGYVFGAFLRDVSAQRKAELIQKTQMAVIQILAEAAAVPDAMPAVLAAISDGFGFDAAGLWLVKADRLDAAVQWSRAGSGVEAFAAASRGRRFARGEGLPGRVWKTKNAVWIDDLGSDSNFPRFAAARRSGLAAAAAFPILAGPEFIGLIEFASKAPLREDASVLGMMADIGSRLGLFIQRKRAEEELRETEERFKIMVEGVKDYAIFMLDPDGLVASWNVGAEEINGYARDEVIGRHVSIFWPDGLAQRHADMALKAAEKDGRHEEEGLRKRKDGSQFLANVVVTALWDGAGKLRGFSKITRDVTMQRHADEQLRRLYEELEVRVESRTKEVKAREAQLRLIANALPVLVGHFDLDEQILFANDAFRSWCSDNPPEILGMTFAEILGHDRYLPLSGYLRMVLEGTPVSFESVSDWQGRRRALNISFIPERASNGVVMGFIFVANDITAHKDAEEQLLHAKEAADAANSAKSAFLANMSHEIRTPLGAVLGFSELLANPDLPPSDRTNYLSAIKRNGELLSTVINDILDLSKVEAGRLEIDRQDASLDELLSDVKTLCNLQALEKGLSLSVNVDGVLPGVIKTDALRLRQILLNIVANAVKFTKSGYVKVTLRRQRGADGREKLAFIVEDSGIGIDPGQAVGLFMPFTQADVSIKRKHGGTGLGLVLSKRLARLLGGDVVLTESVPNVGSTFTITIDLVPVVDRPFESRVSEQPPAPRAMGGTRLDGVRILVVEDSPDNRLLVGRILNLAGAVVESAENGQEALEKLRFKSYDALLMDIQMPIMDGFATTAFLRKEGNKTPIIALTAHAFKEDQDRCRDAGFDDHLAKPINRQILLEKVARYTIKAPLGH